MTIRNSAKIFNRTGRIFVIKILRRKPLEVENFDEYFDFLKKLLKSKDYYESSEKYRKYYSCFEKHMEYLNKLAHYLIRGKNRAKIGSTNDIIHDFYVKIGKKIEQCNAENEKSLIAWMRMIVVNIFRDLLRSRWNFVEAITTSLGDSIAGREKTPSEVLEEKMREEIMLEDLEKLPGMQGQVIVLKDFWGLSTKEISQLMNITPEAIAGLLRRGRKGLKKIISMRSSDSTFKQE